MTEKLIFDMNFFGCKYAHTHFATLSSPSTKRNFIFSCLNAEFLEALAASVTEENSD